MPPVVLRKRLWRELCSHPRLERYVRRSGKFRPINSVGVRIVRVQPVEVAIREEWAASAAVYNKSAEKIAQGDLGEVSIAQNEKDEYLQLQVQGQFSNDDVSRKYCGSDVC